MSLAAFVASKTQNVRVGLNAAPLPLMSPYYWALYFTTLDILSEGRALVGICVGSAKQDFEVSGVEFKNRGDMTDEQLEIIAKLWRGEQVTFRGSYYDCRGMSLKIKPIQRPHPPMFVSGLDPSIPRALKYGDYLCPFYVTVEDVKRYAARLEGTNVRIALYTILAVRDDDQEFDKIIRTAKSLTSYYGRAYQQRKQLAPEAVGIVGNPRMCAEKIKDLQEAGVSYFVLDFQHHGTISTESALRQIELFADQVVPLL